MFRGKISLFGMVSAGLALGLAVLFSVPCAFAQEKADAIDELSLYELRNLEVSIATMTKTTVAEAPSIVSVITGQEIINMGARNLVDVLRTLPGFDFSYAIVTPQHEPYIRGMSGGLTCGKFKVLINGTELSSVEYLIDYIPIRNISRVEIIRGPGSALYGAGAFVGMIDIITKKGGDEPSEISFEGGSYNTIKPSAELSYKKDVFSAYLFTSLNKTDGYDGIVESDAASNIPIFASAAPGEMTGEYDVKTVQTYLSYKDLFFSGLMLKYDSNNPVGVAKALADEDDIDDLYGLYSLGYKMPVTDKGNVLFKASYYHLSGDRLWEIFPEETTEMEMHTGFLTGEGLFGNPLYKQRNISGEIRANFNPVSEVELVGGVSYDYLKIYDVRSFSNYNVTGHPVEIDGTPYPAFPYIRLHTGMTDISDIANWMDEGDRESMAGYLQSIFDFKKIFSLEKGVKTLSVTLGGRYDYYSDFGSTFNPRVGIVYAPYDSIYFKALYGTAFRAPSWGEMYLKNNPSQTGNPDLDPETIETAEFLVGFSFAEYLAGTLNFCKIRIDDSISIVSGKFDNYGSSEGASIEAEVKFQFARNKYAYCNLTWQDVKNTTNATIRSDGGKLYTQEDYNPGSIPEFMGNIGLNWELGKYVNANVSLNYVGEKDRSEEKIWNGETLVLKDQRDPVEARTLVNASLTFRNFYKGMEIQFSGFNLFDEDHRSPDPDGSLYYDFPEAGRWFTGRISYSF